MNPIAVVFLGGGCGAVCRYLVTTRTAQLFGVFPFGTLLVNVTGSFLIGLISGILLLHPALAAWKEEARLLLVVGFLGGFTTFSSFSLENVALVQNQQVLLAFLYTGLHLFLGIISAYLGGLLVRYYF